MGKKKAEITKNRKKTFIVTPLVNPLSATWRIYPSSKWSSQWPYDGYIRHGGMTSCGRGRDSATQECLGRGSRGTIFVRSSKSSLFFQELCPFRRGFFLFPARLKDLAPNVQALGLLVLTMSWRPLWKLCSVTRHFLELQLWPRVFWKFSFFFSKAEPVLLDWQLWRSPGWAKHFGDGTSKTRMKTWLPGVREIVRRRTINRRRDWYESCVVIYSPKDNNKKKKIHKDVSVWLCVVSTLHHPANQRVLRSLFPRPDVATVLHFAVIVYVHGCAAAGRSDCSAGKAKKSSYPWRFRCWSPRRNELECTDLVHWTGASHRFSSRDGIFVVGSVLEKHFDGDFSQDQEKRSPSNVGHRGTKAENLAWHATG